MSSPLLHSAADVLATLLVDLGLGTDPADAGAWPVSVSREPDLPDDAITLFDTTPILDSFSQVTGEPHECHGVQVRFRAATHAVGAAKKRAVVSALDAFVGATVTVDSTDYCVEDAWRTGGTYEGSDATSKRRVLTIDLFVLIRAL